MTSELLEESFKGLDRAKDALNAARHDFKGNFILAAVNRAYYAMFYCANALLHLKNINVKTHNGVRNKFSETYIKTNIFPSSLAEKIGNGYNLREEADYDLDAHILPEEVKRVIDDASDFIRQTEEYIKGAESELRSQDS